MGRKNSAVMPIFGWKDTKNLDFQRRSFNSTRCFCVILPAFCGFLVSGELLQLDAFRASCRNPSKRIATRYARNHSKFCSSSWSAVPEEKKFCLRGPLLWVHKANVFTARKWDSCVQYSKDWQHADGAGDFSPHEPTTFMWSDLN